jgi:glyoxylase I family protein
MIKVLSIDHIVMRTLQPGPLVEFYRDVLNCQPERSLPPDIGLIQLRAGDALIDIVDVESELGRAGGKAPQKSGNNLDHFCLRVAGKGHDLLSELDRHGIENGGFEERYGGDGFGPSVYISDPDGNTLELRPGVSSG